MQLTLDPRDKDLVSFTVANLKLTHLAFFKLISEADLDHVGAIVGMRDRVVRFVVQEVTNDREEDRGLNHVHLFVHAREALGLRLLVVVMPLILLLLAQLVLLEDHLAGGLSRVLRIERVHGEQVVDVGTADCSMVLLDDHLKLT